MYTHTYIYTYASLSEYNYVSLGLPVNPATSQDKLMEQSLYALLGKVSVIYGLSCSYTTMRIKHEHIPYQV